MFLEIAPQTKPCPPPMVAGYACLEVRELHCDADGVRAGHPGGWFVLAQHIEGYTQRPGSRNVLRAKRHTMEYPVVDAPRLACVLDRVVETGSPPRSP